MQPKFIFSSRPSGGDYHAAVAFAQANHFDGIDWNLDCFRIAAASNARKVFCDTALNSGLPSRFHAPCHDVEIAHSNPNFAVSAFACIRMYIDFLKFFGPTYINLHIGSRSISEQELDWNTAVRNLKELVRYGKEQGVTVCLENLKKGWTSDPAKMAALVGESDAMVTLDVGHARAFLKASQSKLSLEEYVKPYADRIRNLHLYEIESVEGRHMPPDNLGAIRDITRWALNHGIDWWVIELSGYDEALHTKALLEKEYFGR
ncbi:MAG TPA: TIM barrel protein [Bacillota bacterium]